MNAIIWHLICQVWRRETKLVLRSVSDVLYPWCFFLLVLSLFPLTLPVNSPALTHMAPGIIWVAAILSQCLILPRLFQDDFQSGVIAQWLISGHPLPFILFLKVVFHWGVNTLPLLGLLPLCQLFFAISDVQLKTLAFALLLGTPIIFFVGAVMSALTVGLRSANVILALLLLPLLMPIVILGAGSVGLASTGMVVSGQLALLGAACCLTLGAAPFACAAALTIASAQ